MSNFPDFKILPQESLVSHEHYDHKRTQPIMRGMNTSEIICHPPIVSPSDDGTLRYMVLDGANHTTAVERMDLQHIVVQVIEPTDPGLYRHSWNHMAWVHTRFMKNLADIPGLRLVLRQEGDLKPAIHDTSSNRSHSELSSTRSVT